LNLHDQSGRLITITNIPVYPADFYTPAVHRILQVAVNLYDSTRTNVYPTIFRPYFTSDGTNVVISGYELVNAPEDTNTPCSFLTVPQDLNEASTRATIGTDPTHINIYGLPWIIGAKKGLPNFNQIDMQTVSQITREIKGFRPSLTPTISQYQFTQMYLVGISNVIGVSLWNSYSNNYPGSVYIQADGYLSMSLTNDFGFQYSTGAIALGGPASAISLGANQWQGSGWISGISLLPKWQSFQIPLFTNYVFLPDLAYQQNPPAFVAPPSSLAWPNPSGDFSQPQWSLNVTNHLRCIIFDGGLPGRVIDYVQLDGLNTYRGLTGEIRTPDGATGLNGLWSTNLTSFGGHPMPDGNANQLNIALGNYSSSDSAWQNNMLNAPFGSARLAAIDLFRVFMRLSPIYYPYTVNTNLEMLVPFSPTAKRYQSLFWQANDPLVHYLSSDLPPDSVIYSVFPPSSSTPGVLTNLSMLPWRYSPWGGNPLRYPYSDTNAFNLALKDPAVASSDSWDFPNGEPLSFATIGRVHRGTPWQTIYLKSSDVDISAWTAWTGDNLFWNTGNPDASLSRPIKDHDLISIIYPLLSTNNPSRQISVNDHSANNWLTALDGLIVQTNSSPPSQIIVSSNSPQAVLVEQSILNNQTFARLGDLLLVPQLTEGSPFLNTNSLASYYAGGLSDEIMESLPSQLLPLVREDSSGVIARTNAQWFVQFTGNDFYSYAIQASPDLLNWINIATNTPSGGLFRIIASSSANSNSQFYRSVLLP
jgi:hypothetical protein